jgi:hypothetical protein
VLHDPVFTADPIVTTNAVEDFTYSTFANFAGRTLADWATDEDESETLTYSKVSGPAWLTVYSKGRLGGKPGAADVGLNSWTVQVSDGNGGIGTAILEIAVLSAIPPAMNIQVSGDNLEVFWPSSYTTYSLYSSTNLVPPVSWSSVSNAPVVEGGDWKVTIPIDEAPPFFILQAP